MSDTQLPREAVEVIKAQHELIDEMMQFAGSMVLQDYGKLNDTLIRSSKLLRDNGVTPTTRTNR